MARHGNVKQKTRKAAAKRFSFTKNGKVARRHTMQAHFNAGRSKKTIRRRRSDLLVHSNDIHRVAGMLPFSPAQRTRKERTSCQE